MHMLRIIEISSAGPLILRAKKHLAFASGLQTFACAGNASRSNVADRAAELALACNSSTHKADHAVLMRMSKHTATYPEICAAVKAGGTRLKECLAKLIVAREDLAGKGMDTRLAGSQVEARITKEIKAIKDLQYLGEFWYESDILKDLDFNQSELQRVIREREQWGLKKGFVMCPNKNVRKYWWATKQTTLACFLVGLRSSKT